jgi:FKBP-type peptidyl-prolyl cis-trans isomerase
LKLRTILSAAAAVAALTACHDNPTAVEIGPIPPLPAGATIVTTESGLQYADITVGTGTQAKLGDHVAVQYTGWVASTGKGFDTSVGLNPLQVTLSGDGGLTGFQEGIIGMKVGGKRRLFVPAELGYGSLNVYDEHGKLLVPANSDLVYDVELVQVSAGS